MSISVEQLSVKRVVDSRTNAEDPSDRIYGVLEGAADIGYQSLSQDGGVASTNMTFTLNPPSPQVFVNRRVMLSVTFQLTFTGQSAGAGIPLLQCAGLAAAPGVNPGLQYYDAPRAYPIANSATTVQFSLGNDRLSQNLGMYWRGMTRYNNRVSAQDLWHGMTATMLDQSQQYSDLNGFARDPLRGYGDNPLQCPRGGFVGATVIRNDSTGAPGDIAIVNLSCTEMLDLSPFLFEEGAQDVGFIGVQNQQFTITLTGRGNGALAGLAGTLWSHSTLGSVLASASAVVQSSLVRVSYLTPDPTMRIPRSMNYKYSEITYYPTTVQTPVAPGSSIVITQNNLQLQSIPQRILFWVSPQDPDFNLTKTDTYYNISAINVSFDNRDSLLANASAEDIYQVAVKNGTNLSWRQWTRDCGSVLALDFGEDIPLRATQAPGLRGTFNLRLTITCTNLGAAASIPTLSLMTIAEGVLSINNQNVIRNIGVLSQQDILNSKNSASSAYHPTGSVYGGAWYDDVWSWVKKIGRPALNAAKMIVPAIAPQYAPAVLTADKIASAVGVGAMSGGKRISRAKLAKLMR